MKSTTQTNQRGDSRLLEPVSSYGAEVAKSQGEASQQALLLEVVEEEVEMAIPVDMISAVIGVVTGQTDPSHLVANGQIMWMNWN